MLKKLGPEDYRSQVKEWVMQQSDDRTYRFMSSHECVIGQFLADHHISSVDDAERYWTHAHNISGYSIVLAGNVDLHMETFGALKERMTNDYPWSDV